MAPCCANSFAHAGGYNRSRRFGHSPFSRQGNAIAHYNPELSRPCAHCPGNMRMQDLHTFMPYLQLRGSIAATEDSPSNH
jgi:hypothetical protein